MSTRRYALAIAALGFLAALIVVVYAGQTVAYRHPATTPASAVDTADRPAEPVGRAGRILELDLPVLPPLAGTDTGLIATPAA